ncbi:hypothetical protein [Mesorhizobium sp. M0220]|uniref:hypothetical protein n=1 Tax=Mesorhizobium sp. M0220 TaxID=2956920 RepID=UPI00333AE430
MTSMARWLDMKHSHKDLVRYRCAGKLSFTRWVSPSNEAAWRQAIERTCQGVLLHQDGSRYKWVAKPLDLITLGTPRQHGL